MPLFSFEHGPWSLLPKTLLRPKNIDYVKEIARRSSQYNIQPIPRPSNWTRVQILEWLERNPVCEVADVSFLKNEVRRVQDVLVRAQRLQQENHHFQGATSDSGGRRNWRGPIPYLRIIMCLTQDHVKSLFLNRANTRTRQELDARNSETRYETGFSLR